MKYLIVLFVSLGLAMSFPRPTPLRGPQERGAVKDLAKNLADAVMNHPYRDLVKMPEMQWDSQERGHLPNDPQFHNLVRVPPFISHNRAGIRSDPQERGPVHVNDPQYPTRPPMKDPKERYPVELKKMMTG